MINLLEKGDKMFYSNKDLVNCYILDLETDISQCEILILEGQNELIEYKDKCIFELEKLKNDLLSEKLIAVNRYGMPSVEEGIKKEKEVIQLIKNCIT